MKIRSYFVSNSSSSSFVVGKAHMTNDQIEKFQKWLQHEYDTFDGWISETKHYFLGTIDIHDSAVIDFLTNIGIDKEYMGVAM